MAGVLGTGKVMEGKIGTSEVTNMIQIKVKLSEQKVWERHLAKARILEPDC